MSTVKTISLILLEIINIPIGICLKVINYIYVFINFNLFQINLKTKKRIKQIRLVGKSYFFRLDKIPQNELYTSSFGDDLNIVMNNSSFFDDLCNVVVSLKNENKIFYQHIDWEEKIYAVSGYIKYGDETVQILKENPKSSNHNYIEIRKLNISNQKGEKKCDVTINCSFKKEFRGWFAYDFLFVLNDEAMKASVDIDIKLFVGTLSCEIVVKPEFKNSTISVSDILQNVENILSELFVNVEKTLNLSKQFKIIMPEHLKIPIQQYLNFFEEFVSSTKGAKIIFDVLKVEEGLLIKTKENEDISHDEILRWLGEYVELIKKKTKNENYIVNFEKETTENNANLFLVKLDNELSSAQNRFKILQLELNYLKEENKLLSAENKYLLNQNDNNELSFLSGLRLLPTRYGHLESKTELNELLAKDYVEIVIEKLLRRELPKDEYNLVVKLSSDFHNFKKEYMQNLIDSTEKNLRESKIKVALIDLVSKFSE